MTLNNSMSITPSPPGHAKGVRFEHGSVLGGKTRAARVSSQWKSTVPRAALVVVEAEFVLGRLETILDRPAVSFDLDQGFDACCVGTPGGEEGHIVIGDVAADQHPSCP